MAIQSPTANLFQARKAHCLNHYGPFFRASARRYDLFRGFQRGTWQQYRNAIHIPFLLTVITADVARKVQIAFGNRHVVDFEGTDSKVARRNARLINQQFEDDGMLKKAIDFLTSADIYGTAFAQYGWKTVRRLGTRRELTITLTGEEREQIVKGPITDFDGPSLEVVDLLDCWPQVGINSPEKIRWWIRRRFLDFQEVEMWANLGVYSKAAVEELRRSGGAPRTVVEAYNLRQTIYRTQQEYMTRSAEPHNKVVEVSDMIGYVPDEFAPDGQTFRLITVANDTVVLRNKPHPHWDGKPNILVYAPIKDPHYIHGIGKIEPVEKLSYLANRFSSQQADALDFNLDPPIFFNRLIGLDDEQLYMRAGRLIGVDGPVGEENIRPFMPDMRGFNVANQEVANIWQHIQQATGQIQDTALGMSASDRQTAAEFQGRMSQVNQRLMVESYMFDTDFIEPAADAFRSLNGQFLKLPAMLRRIGQDAQIDPITGEPVQDDERIDINDLNPFYKARARGATRMASKIAARGDLVALNDVFARNPMAMQAIAWTNWLRYTFDVFDVPNPGDFLVKQMPGAEMLAAQAQVKPQDLLSSSAGGLGALSQLFGGQAA